MTSRFQCCGSLEFRSEGLGTKAHMVESRSLVEARGSIYTTILELGPQNHNGDGLLGLNSITVVYMDPLGKLLNITSR